MHLSLIRGAALLCSAVLVLAACTGDEHDSPTAPEPTSPGVADEPDRLETYRVGMFQDMASESWWAYLDDADAWSGYVLNGSACQLYELSPPNFVVTPQIAAHAWPEPEQDGSDWRVEVSVLDGISWSDGEPITAHDVEFTFNTVIDLALTGQWLSSYQPAALEAGTTLDVVALDDRTVRITFADRPGLGTWPMALALASIMPEHHWGPIVEGAADASELLATSGAGSPTCGAYVFDERDEGVYARSIANDRWFLSGAVYTHYADGTVHLVHEGLGVDDRFGASTGQNTEEVVATYQVGPHAEEVEYLMYGNAAVAVQALLDGEIAYLFSGPGLEPAAQDRIFDADDVAAVVNANYGLQFLGFNMGRAPMDDLAFREAVATVIDRVHIAQTVMGGAAFPLYTRMPSGNTAWYDPAVGDALTERWAGFNNQAERVTRAVEILTDAGYTWESPPVVNDESGDIVERGRGIAGPDGQPIRQLEVLHPTAGYDPLRNTAGLFIAQFIGDLGVDVVTAPTEFSQLVGMVINPADLRYDMAVLGWGLGNPALPTYFDMFFRSTAPLNITAYQSDEFDDAVTRFMAADTFDAAFDIMWQEMEPILDRDLPYVPLFDSRIVEGYRPGDVHFQFTEVLSGLGNLAGMRDTVMTAR